MFKRGADRLRIGSVHRGVRHSMAHFRRNFECHETTLAPNLIQLIANDDPTSGG